MTTTPPPGQPTIIQRLIARFQNFTNSRPVQTISLVIIAGFFVIEKTNDGVQFYQSVCRTNFSLPLCPPEKFSPEWIGTKIEDVYIKKLKNYEPETTLVVTDKPEKSPEWEDISVLRNVDQNLSNINLGFKRNSGQFEAYLRKKSHEKKPVCLQIYGKRKFETSEFKNIIDYKEFPSNQVYDNLTPQERDTACKEEPTIRS